MTLARVRALLVVGSLAALAAMFVIWAIMRDSQTDPASEAERRCSEGQVPAATAVPEPKALTINVYNDTDEGGLAKRVAGELKARGFKIGKVGNDPNPNPVKGTAELRFGPKGLGGAHLLSAHLIAADMVPDTERDGAVVDVVLGQEFKQLASPSEVNDALRLIEDPSPPPGMC
ncbi:MAG: LytR C-terminal domain-containing protein [Micromonosporaceae bacterium]